MDHTCSLPAASVWGSDIGYRPRSAGPKPVGHLRTLSGGTRRHPAPPAGEGKSTMSHDRRTPRLYVRTTGRRPRCAGRAIETPGARLEVGRTLAEAALARVAHLVPEPHAPDPGQQQPQQERAAIRPQPMEPPVTSRRMRDPAVRARRGRLTYQSMTLPTHPLGHGCLTPTPPPACSRARVPATWGRPNAP